MSNLKLNIAKELSKEHALLLNRVKANIQLLVGEMNSRQNTQKLGVVLNDEPPLLPASDEQLTHAITSVFDDGVQSEECGIISFIPFSDLTTEKLIEVLSALEIEISNSNEEPELEEKEY